MEPGQGTVTTLGSETILAGKNVVRNDAKFEAGTYVRGEIVGKKQIVSEVAAADAGNTGNGTIGTVSDGVKVKLGTYIITMLTATTFSVYSPDGEYLGAGATGSAFTSVQIVLTITVGATPMIAGDFFTVVVSEVSSNYSTLVEGASDGTEIPSGICLKDVTLASAGYNPIAFGEFSKAGIQVVMSALSTPVTITDAMVNDLDSIGCFLKNS